MNNYKVRILQKALHDGYVFPSDIVRDDWEESQNCGYVWRDFVQLGMLVKSERARKNPLPQSKGRKEYAYELQNEHKVKVYLGRLGYAKEERG